MGCIVWLLMAHNASVSTGKRGWKGSVKNLHRRLEAGENIPPSKARDLMELATRERHEQLLYRRAQDIWNRLSERERNAMRFEVKSQDPVFRKGIDDWMVESRCVRLIKEELRGEKITDAAR